MDELEEKKSKTGSVNELLIQNANGKVEAEASDSGAFQDFPANDIMHHEREEQSPKYPAKSLLSGSGLDKFHASDHTLNKEIPSTITEGDLTYLHHTRQGSYAESLTVSKQVSPKPASLVAAITDTGPIGDQALLYAAKIDTVFLGRDKSVNPQNPSPRRKTPKMSAEIGEPISKNYTPKGKLEKSVGDSGEEHMHICMPSTDLQLRSNYDRHAKGTVSDVLLSFVSDEIQEATEKSSEPYNFLDDVSPTETTEAIRQQDDSQRKEEAAKISSQLPVAWIDERPIKTTQAASQQSGCPNIENPSMENSCNNSKIQRQFQQSKFVSRIADNVDDESSNRGSIATKERKRSFTEELGRDTPGNETVQEASDLNNSPAGTVIDNTRIKGYSVEPQTRTSVTEKDAFVCQTFLGEKSSHELVDTGKVFSKEIFHDYPVLEVSDDNTANGNISRNGRTNEKSVEHQTICQKAINMLQNDNCGLADTTTASSEEGSSAALDTVGTNSRVDESDKGVLEQQPSLKADQPASLESLGFSSSRMMQSQTKHMKNMGVRDHVIRKSNSGRLNINWFPRKKCESYLERKIRMLQEADGMIETLDQTLVDSHVVLPRVEREKRQVQRAASDAMDTCKAALVEASWCRILQAAGISCKTATAVLEKAQEEASAAFDRAVTLGVIMKNNPTIGVKENSTASNKLGKHNITASFMTPFDVEKEVAAAVKVAFIRMAAPQDDHSTQQDGISTAYGSTNTNYDSSSETQVQTLETKEEDSSVSMNAEPASSSDLLTALAPSRGAPESLVQLMMERMKLLSSDELASLEKIVSTRGLSDLLKESSSEQQKAARVNDSDGLVNKQINSLDAAKAGSSTQGKPASSGSSAQEKGSDLGSILVKHVSRLQRDLQRAKSSMSSSVLPERKKSHAAASEEQVEDLDKILVKHVSKLEREKMECASKAPQRHTVSARTRKEEQQDMPGLGEILKKKEPFTKFSRKIDSRGGLLDKENSDSTNQLPEEPGVGPASDSEHVFAKHPSRLNRDVKDTHVAGSPKKRLSLAANTGSEKKDGGGGGGLGLDQVLVKHVSRLEKEKMEAKSKEADNDYSRKPASSSRANRDNESLPGLSEMLKKAVAPADTRQHPSDPEHPQESRRSSRQKEHMGLWGGLGLGDALKPHLSKLQMEQAAWRLAEEEERRKKAA